MRDYEPVSSLTQTVAYGYNAAGQLTTLTYPSGRVVTYGYANNRPVSVSVDAQVILDSAVYGPSGRWAAGAGATRP